MCNEVKAGILIGALLAEYIWSDISGVHCIWRYFVLAFAIYGIICIADKIYNKLMRRCR